MSERKETPKESSKDTSKQTQLVDVSRLNESFAEKAVQGNQGILLAPVGSQATDPFVSQDTAPASIPQVQQPTQAAPTDNTPQSQTSAPSQANPESSKD